MSLPEIFYRFSLIAPENLPDSQEARAEVARDIETTLGIEIAVEKVGDEFSFVHGGLLSYLGFDTAHYLKIFLDRIDPKAVVKLVAKHALELHLNLSIYIIDETPSLNFSPQLIQQIADLGGTLDIDVILTNPRPITV